MRRKSQAPIVLVDRRLSDLYCAVLNFAEGVDREDDDFSRGDFFEELAALLRANPVDGEHRDAYLRWAEKVSQDKYDDDEECECPKCTYHRLREYPDFSPDKYLRWLTGEIETAAWITYRRGLKQLRKERAA